MYAHNTWLCGMAFALCDMTFWYTISHHMAGGTSVWDIRGGAVIKRHLYLYPDWHYYQDEIGILFYMVNSYKNTLPGCGKYKHTSIMCLIKWFYLIFLWGHVYFSILPQLSKYHMHVRAVCITSVTNTLLMVNNPT